MVRSSISEAERRAWNRALGLGFVLLVGGSGGLIAVAGDADLDETLAVTVLGLATGAVLLYYLSKLSTGGSVGREHRER